MDTYFPGLIISIINDKYAMKIEGSVIEIN